ISDVTIRHRSDFTAVALMLAGWLASRLRWQPHALGIRDGRREGRLRGRRGEVHVTLAGTDDLSVPGLAGVTLETAHGYSMSLERGPGGLTAHRRTRDGREWRWTGPAARCGGGTTAACRRRTRALTTAWPRPRCWTGSRARARPSTASRASARSRGRPPTPTRTSCATASARGSRSST